MKRFQFMQKACAVMFLVAIFAFSAFNIYVEGPSLINGIKMLALPKESSELKRYVQGAENVVNTNIAERIKFIEFYAYLQKLMGKKESGGFDIVQSDQGELIYANFYAAVPDRMSEYARRMWRMSIQADKHDAKVMFVNPTDMYVRGYSNYYAGLPAYDQNDSQDALLYYLQSYGVEWLDTRSALYVSGLPLEKFQYKTDHHWTTEAAFEAFRAIVERLNERFDANLDPSGFYRNIDNYNAQTYPDSFLGTLGQRSGLIFSELDDFTLIWPKFDTEYIWEAYREDRGITEKRGDFVDALLLTYALRTDDPYETGLYAAYMGGSNAWVKLTNTLNPNGPKLFLVHDSYSLPLASFLSQLFSEIHMVWPLAPGQPIDIEEYLQDNEFDYIIVALYSGNLNGSAFAFYTEPLEEEVNALEEARARAAQEGE